MLADQDHGRVRQQVIQLLSGYQSQEGGESHPAGGPIYRGDAVYRGDMRHRPWRRSWVRRHPGPVGLVLGCVSGGIVTGIAAALLGSSSLQIRRGVVIRLNADQAAALAADLQRRRGRRWHLGQ